MVCQKSHNMCVKEHIYRVISARRRVLGLSQQKLADRIGLRREKLNRVESKREDIGLGDLCRLMDALGLDLDVTVRPRASRSSKHRGADENVVTPASLIARNFDESGFIDASKAKIVSWGRIPG